MARFSYFFSLFAKIGQIFNLHLLICQFFILFLLVNISQIFIPFSISFLKLAARFHNFFSVLAKIGHIFVLFSKFVSFSYFFLLFKIYQMFILFQSPCQNLPDGHAFSISFSKIGRLALVIRGQLKKFRFLNLTSHFKISSEPERALKGRRPVSASISNN